MQIIKKPIVSLLAATQMFAPKTDSPLEIIREVGTTCYQSETQKTPEQFTKMLIDRGHWAMVEFVDVVARIRDCSRGLTHEIVRHRISSLAQRSTRYVNPLKKDGFRVIAPPGVDVDEWLNEERLTFGSMVETMEMWYALLIDHGYAPEDARQLLPIGIETGIDVKFNLREWHHAFFMRTSKFAHWEIRSAMNDLLKIMQPMYSPVFDDFVLAGVDKKGIDYYKIKGQVDDINKMIDEAHRKFATEITSTAGPTNQDTLETALKFKEFMKDYYNQNY